MSNIVIAFSKKEAALNIKKILAQSGYPVTAVCATGAHALQKANELEDGILICGSRFVDMMYSELYEYLPDKFQMLLIASATAVMEKEVRNLVCLTLPMKVHELLETVEMMDSLIVKRCRKLQQSPKLRTEEDRQMIQEAKELLMNRNKLSEEEAHRYIQKHSMDSGTSLVEISQMIISLMGNG